MRAPPAIVWTVCLVLGLFAPCFVTTNAYAYTWMIRHGYTGCMPCHTDPSGGGPLTPYGRAQGELLMQTRFGEPSEEASPLAGLAWGALQTSDAVRAGGDFREGFFSTKVAGAPRDNEFITMQAELFADFKLGRFRAEGDIGYAPLGDLPAALTDNQTGGNVISRDHWLGYELDEDGSWLLRAGRINVPFGIRVIEHTLFARVLTQTDTDATQEYGVALSVNKERFRGEVMGIAGNFEIHPDDYRQRGYSGYFEYAPDKTLALGASSYFTRAERDLTYGVTDYRFENGVFARYAVADGKIVLLAEADSVYQSLTWNGHRGGYAAFVQADIEPITGLHLAFTAESMNSGTKGESDSYSAWASLFWFCWSHVDVRVDSLYQSIGSSGGNTAVTALLLQLHAYL